jgi:uncharacterized iron-regulated membrane protein
MKTFFRTIHLYLGLAAGIVIMITCFTGATLVFEKELQHWFYPERYSVQNTGNKVPIQQLVVTLQQQVPGAKISSVRVYNDPDRSAELSYTLPDKEKKGPEKKAEAGKGGGNSQAFMNPYTGQLISLYNNRNTFFFTMFSLHRWLLAGDTGKLIVGISTSIFLFILITGIVLWWPKKIKKIKQRLTLKWNAGWKRINHDLHITIGFYSAIFLFLFAFTGLAWSFEWFNDAIYTLTGTENKRPQPPTSIYQAESKSITLDEAYQAIQQQAPLSEYYTISLPKDSIGAVSIQVMSTDPEHEKASDQYFLDQYTGSLIGTALYKDRNLGQRVRSTFYPIHVGSIAGLPGRIIAFLTCIAGVTFPVTGVILWLNRLSKEKKKSKKHKQPSKIQTADLVKEIK